MISFLPSKVFSLFLAACFFSGFFSSVSAQAEEDALNLKGTRILICAGYYAGLEGMPVLKKLRDAGAEVRFGNRAELTWEELKKYQILIVIFDQVTKSSPHLERSNEAIEKFVQAGGGVLFFGTGFELTDTINQTLAHFGAKFLKEYLQDSQHTFKTPNGFYNLHYAYTQDVKTDHPVTKGVEGLWYNVDPQSAFLYDTRGIEVSKDWTTLVSGDSSASTFRVDEHFVQGEDVSKEAYIAGKYKKSPPLFAVRTFGDGAVALTGLNPVEVFYGQELPHYGEVATKYGDGQYTSDFYQLYKNTLTWLAEHGRKAEELGKGDLSPIVDSFAEDGKRTFDWADPNLLAGQSATKPIKGVIGLHSTLSDGKDTPEALIAKAKESGLQWVAFTERLEDLIEGEWEKVAINQTEIFVSSEERSEAISPSKWEQLRKICREASTEDFAVLPGIDYAVEGGDRWVAFGDFDWPEAKIFSEDKKTVLNPTWWFTAGTVPNGPYNVGKNRLHPWNATLYCMWPVRTTIAGKQTDETLENFKHQQGVQQDPYPMAVDMVYNVDQLGEAASRMCNYLILDKPGDLSKFYRDHHYYGSLFGFISDGPVVTDWRSVNVARSTGGKWYAPTTEQYRIKLSAKSDAPITDIQFFDGFTLFQRFRPHEPEVTVSVDIPHDKQRNIFAVITDANGKQAITGGQFSRDLINWRFMCADRANSICDIVTADEGGTYIAGPSAPYQRTMQIFGISHGVADRPFIISPPQVDGGMRPISIDILPSIFYQFAIDPKHPDIFPRLEARMEIPVASRDGILQEYTSTGIVDNAKGDGWTGRQVPWELDGMILNVRFLNMVPQVGDMGVILLEGEIEFTKDVTIKEPITITSSRIEVSPQNGDHYAVVTPDVQVMGQSQSTPFHVDTAMEPGSYAMLFPAQMGSVGVMALDAGYELQLDAQSPSTYLATQIADTRGRNMKAGEKIPYRMLLVRGRFGELINNANWEDFVQTMGLRGEPAYQVKDLKAGKVSGTRFLLELVPQDSGVSGIITQAKLPLRLPVRVSDMNPYWTFGWFDRDRKEWYPSAVDQKIDRGFFSVDTRRGDTRFFAGHPVVSDQKDLRILVTSDGKSKVDASVNNVGDVPMDAVVRLNPALGQAEPVHIHLASGETKQLTFAIQP